MECLSSSATVSWFVASRKKRSNSNRRPHPDPKLIFNFTLRTSITDYGRESNHSNGNLRTDAYSKSFNPASGDHIKSDANKQSVADPVGNKKLKKVKLKLGGVTRTLHTKLVAEVALEDGPYFINTFDTGALSGAQLKQNIPRNSLGAKENSSRKDLDRNNDGTHKLGHKSKRVAKKVAGDEDFDEEDDEEIRYLKKLRACRAVPGHGEKQEVNGIKSKLVADLTSVDYIDAKDVRKMSRPHEDDDYEMGITSDDELKNTRKRPTGEFVEHTTWSGQEMTMTTRKRALECPEFASPVEYPNGLPPAPSKKQKLSEEEQQIRKAEIARRRKFLADKAAKEAEAGAIRKILGQDSNRKKEEKLKKQRADLAQEKLGKVATLGPNTIRWSMGPNGTVITFSEDIGLPSIFNSLPCKYPPPREKCVGPNCTNEYKYRDSKSKVPLCSLQCYKAMQGNVELLRAC